MLNGNAVRKNFTFSSDAEAEKLLQDVLSGLHSVLVSTGLSVYLGGSYGRGDGGVRQDRENGVLYNDLDLFVFAEKKPVAGTDALLKEIARSYKNRLKVDVDFSRIMTVQDIRNNAQRLMMQELKRGYVLICGKDLLEEHLLEIPAENLPYSEACRLLLNRGMGLLLAADKLASNSADTDFILRNLYKAILGAWDAILIASGNYQWKIGDRLEAIRKSELPAIWKELYREAVDFKHSPHRVKKEDMNDFWCETRAFLCSALFRCAGVSVASDLTDGFCKEHKKRGELNWKNYIKYCIRTRQLFVGLQYRIPSVTMLLTDLYAALAAGPGKLDFESNLYRQWQIFN